MTSPWINRHVLRLLNAAALTKAFARYRNPRRRAIGRHQTAFYHRVWREAAAELGAAYRTLGSDIAEIELDGVRTRVCENTCAIDDPVTLAVLSDKHLTYEILAQERLPTPAHATFTLADMAPALAFLKSSADPCVVKPASGTGGGRGITTGILRPSHLARAAAAAAVYCDRLLIERQIPGDNYRLLYLDGQPLDAFARRHPSVAGDGRSTVARLVRAANDDRLRKGSGRSQVLLSEDLDMRRTLAAHGLSLRSVPPAGSNVTLKTVVNENDGADNVTATDLLCSEILEDCSRAVRALDVRLAGVDVITPNPTVPLRQAGGVILEVNAPPNFYYHYHKRDGAFPVAVHVLKRLLRTETEVEVAVGSSH